jgi:hypothetical protein
MTPIEAGYLFKGGYMKVETKERPLLMCLVDNGGRFVGEFIPYDGRTLGDEEAKNLPNFSHLSGFGSVRHWTLASGHTGFLVIQS